MSSSRRFDRQQQQGRIAGKPYQEERHGDHADNREHRLKSAPKYEVGHRRAPNPPARARPVLQHRPGSASSHRSGDNLRAGLRLSTVYMPARPASHCPRNSSRLASTEDRLPMRNRTLRRAPDFATSPAGPRCPERPDVSADSCPFPECTSKVVAAISSDIATLDPTIYHAIISFHARLNIFDALTDIGPDGTVVPRFATKWEKSADAKSWTFTIRTGAKFHNGEPVTIDDVIFSYQKIMDDEKSPTRVYVNNIASIDRVSDTQIRFNLKTPFAPFDRNATLIAVIPKKAYHGDGSRRIRQEADRLRPLSPGQLGEGRPHGIGGIRRLVGRRTAGQAGRRAAGAERGCPFSRARFRARSTSCPALPPALMQTLNNRPGVKVKVTDGYKVVYLGFNPADPSLKDIKMRQAIDAAIDRNAITPAAAARHGHSGRPDSGEGQLRLTTTSGRRRNSIPSAPSSSSRTAVTRVSRSPSSIRTTSSPRPTPSPRPSPAISRAAGINVKLEGMEYNGFYALWSGKKLSGMHMFVFGPSLSTATCRSSASSPPRAIAATCSIRRSTSLRRNSVPKATRRSVLTSSPSSGARPTGISHSPSSTTNARRWACGMASSGTPRPTATFDSGR